MQIRLPLSATAYTPLTQAIWPDALTTVGPCEYRLQIPVELDAPTTIQFEASEGAAGPTTVAPVRLSQLPTVSISFALPANYPLEAPPRIVSLFSTHDWLAPASIARAREALDPMWTHGDGILDSWVEWVRGGEMLRALELFRGDTIVYVGISTYQLLILRLVLTKSNTEFGIQRHTSFCSFLSTMIRASLAMHSTARRFRVGFANPVSKARARSSYPARTSSAATVCTTTGLSRYEKATLLL